MDELQRQLQEIQRRRRLQVRLDAIKVFGACILAAIIILIIESRAAIG